MKSSTKSFVLGLTLLTAAVSGCDSKSSSIEEDNSPKLEDYTSIYNGTSTKKNGIIWTSTEINKASYGYKFNSDQGYNHWYFYFKTGTSVSELVGNNGRWESYLNDVLEDGIINTKEDNSIIMSYQVQEAGQYALGGTLRGNSESTSVGNLTIYKNQTQIYPSVGSLEIEAGDIEGRYVELTENFQVNDEIKFEIKGQDIYFNPAVVKGNSLLDSLYNTHNDWTYYGDLHAYYYKGKVHLYHLWNHTGNDSGWRWYMQTTSDMFRYVDGGYDDSFVKDHYMKYGSWPDLFYPYYISSRDRTVFFDKDIGKYRTIGLCYVNKTAGSISTDLALRTSDDALGYEWSQDPIPLRRFPKQSDGEPECSQIFKLGNRWYLSTGISGQSVHGVGGLSYWFGEEGQTIDQIDWQNLPTHRLDGEDLCVPQIEKVADKYYMFGWMPQQYSQGYWGGYKNLAREVFQNEDGTLGSRFDLMATKLLNKGRYFDLNQNSIVSQNFDIANWENDSIVFKGASKVNISGKANSSFVKYHVDLEDATSVSLLSAFEGTADVISSTVYLDGGKTYVKVTDQTGFKSSDLLISNQELKNLDLKVVVERGIVEICVNDLKVMSARTRANVLTWNPGFSTNGSCKISNISFNRLAQYYSVYD